MVVSIITLVFNTVPAFYSSIRTGFAERGVIVQVSLQYITRVPLTMPSVATPIALIVLLKSIRAAMREGYVRTIHRMLKVPRPELNNHNCKQ